MGLKKVILSIFLLVWSLSGWGQAALNTQPRILILLDKSSSMVQPWEGGRVKTKVADELILKLMDSIYAVNREVEFSLRVFGAQYSVADNNCRDTKNEVPFAKDNRLQMEYRLDDLKPLGVTSIAFALQEAADKDLVDVNNNAYSIILITDGGESCGGDICAVMRKLEKSKVFFRPYIVNLESSATLRASYACMGDYLEVTKSGDIKVAIGKIVEAFKPMIRITPAEYTKVKEVNATAPTVAGVKIPVVRITDTVRTRELPRAEVYGPRMALIGAPRPIADPVRRPVPTYKPVITEEAPEVPEVVKLDKLATDGLRMVPGANMMVYKPSATKLPEWAPKVEEEAVKESISRIAVGGTHSMAIAPVAATRPNVVAVPAYKPVIEEEVAPIVPEKIARLTPSPVHRIMTLILLEDGTTLPYRKLPPAPPLKFDIEPVKPKPVVKGPMAKLPEGKPMEYTVEAEDAKETTVEVYFTNGSGKFYVTTPQIMLLNAQTGALAKRFYRTVDENGNPDPQKGIEPGLYHLTFAESKSVYVNNVEIEANKTNKIFVKVHKASLSFEYGGNLKRPVSEFAAMVIERNKVEGGTIVNQKCTDKLEYEPGNYHVVINTFPQDVRNIDLDFNEKVITLLQPGFVKFSAADGIPAVKLYQQLGDKYRQFHILPLSDPSAKHLQIQPGKYQAHYNKGPGGTYASEKVVEFVVKSNEETEVLLN